MHVVGFLPGAGTRPGGRPPFLSRDKKGGKETRPAVCDPHAARGGTPGARRWRGALRNSLRAYGASLKQPQRVRPRSMRDFAHATPPPPRPRRSLKGGGDNSGHRCARPGVRGAQRLRVGGRAQRWPVSGFNPLLAVPRSAGRGAGACAAGYPEAKRRGYGQQGRASFASFSCTRKKRESPAGASPGPGKQTPKSAKTAPNPIAASASSSKKRSNQAFSEYPFGQPPGRSQHSSQPRSRAVWPMPGLKVLVGSSAR